MVTFTDSDDRKSAYLRNKAIQNANTVRERRATVENPQWAMSRPADWYTELDDQGELSNLRSIKDTLVNQQGNRDFWTTDQDEGRNMYQMLMNQMKGGDKGARLIDTRGLPDQSYRTGRKIFQDPSKSQGFFGDLRTMGGDLIPGVPRSPNPAAIHVNEYNPFPKAGFGADWYKDQFPIASGLDSLMGLAEKSPTLQFLTSMFPKSNRVPLERDLSWVPEGVGEYNKIPEIPFEGEEVGARLLDEIIPESLVNTPIDANETSEWYPSPFDDEVTITDLPDITENIEELGEEEIFNQTYEFVDKDRGDDPNLPTAWEYMIQMQDLLGWENERMTQHLIDNGVLRAK